MRYAQIRSMDISNGEHIGIALFVQGCHFHCKNCFNQETWDFNEGKEWTPEIREEFVQLADKEYIKRVSFLGGEPMAEENCQEILSVAQELKNKYPHIEIWLYTGYEWEELKQKYPEVKEYFDVVVAGPYIDSLKDVNNKITHWAGSTNQKVIRIKEMNQIQKQGEQHDR